MQDDTLPPACKTIALIDDDEDLLYMVQNFLRKEGFRALAYPSGVEFTKALEIQSIDPDLIVIDVEMPFKSGIDVIYDCTTRLQLKTTPVIFLTGKSDALTISNAFENNATFLHYLLKPVNLPLLLMNIQKMLILKEQHLAIAEANAGLSKLTKQLQAENKDVKRESDASYTAVLQLRSYIQDLTWQLTTRG